MRSMNISRAESDNDANVFIHSAVIGYCYHPVTCLYGTFCPCCAIASAKSLFDGSDWCFNCVCFGYNPCIVRNYVRMGYEIDGRAGYSDCFCPCICCPCAVTQLLNEIKYRGPKIYRTEKVNSSPGSAWMAERKIYSLVGDVPDFCCTFLTCNCESANVFSQLSGVPFWFAFSFSNICQTQHLMRKSYGIDGDDCYTDCVRPCMCMSIPGLNAVYFYKELASLRAEMATRGRAYNYTIDRPPLPLVCRSADNTGNNGHGGSAANLFSVNGDRTDDEHDIEEELNSSGINSLRDASASAPMISTFTHRSSSSSNSPI